jgi:hypothetical protein
MARPVAARSSTDPMLSPSRSCEKINSISTWGKKKGPQIYCGPLFKRVQT